MNLLGGYGSSDSSDMEEAGAGLKRARQDQDESAGVKRMRPESGGEVALDRRAQLCQSLKRLLAECPLLPSEETSAARRKTWAWFEEICRAEFSKELQAGGGELVVFGSWTYNMWVVGSDIDVNVRTLDRIPRFFPRLKSAITSKDPLASVEVITSAAVPLAKISVQGLQIDVTHEVGPDNEVARHHIQVKEWAKRWESDEVVCTSMRIIKLWATAKDVHSPRNNTLNSMGYMVMLLAVAHGGGVARDGESKEEHGSSSSSSSSREDAFADAVADLLSRFFAAYSASVRPGVPRHVVHGPYGLVSPGLREADVFRLSQNVDDSGNTGFGTSMFVQDPFLQDVNLARFVDSRSLRRMAAALQDADRIMTQGTCDALQQLVRKRKVR